MNAPSANHDFGEGKRNDWCGREGISKQVIKLDNLAAPWSRRLVGSVANLYGVNPADSLMDMENEIHNTIRVANPGSNCNSHSRSV